MDTNRLTDVTPKLASNFIDQAVQRPSTARADPADPTRRTRRLAIRTLFGAARQLGFTTSEPTVDIKLPFATPTRRPSARWR